MKKTLQMFVNLNFFKKKFSELLLFFQDNEAGSGIFQSERSQESSGNL